MVCLLNAKAFLFLYFMKNTKELTTEQLQRLTDFASRVCKKLPESRFVPRFTEWYEVKGKEAVQDAKDETGAIVAAAKAELHHAADEAKEASEKTKAWVKEHRRESLYIGAGVAAVFASLGSWLLLRKRKK